MDLTGFFQAVQNGGPPVIFVLCVLVALFLTGEVRVKREVEDRDKIIEAQGKRIDELGDRYDREHELFQSSLSLIKDEMLPMLRERSGATIEAAGLMGFWSWFRQRHAPPNRGWLEQAEKRLQTMDAQQRQQADALSELRGRVGERRLDRIERLRYETEQQNRLLGGNGHTT